MKKKITFALLIALPLMVELFSCKIPESITSKTGSQLWAENCIRCHTAPSPTDYSDEQWETIGLHMQTRANLLPDEVEKIVEFLKQGNN